MKKNKIFFLLILVIISCKPKVASYENKEEYKLETSQSNQKNDVVSAEFEMALIPDSSSDIAIFPIMYNSNHTKRISYSKEMVSGHINMLFLNTQTDEQRLLTDKKHLIEIESFEKYKDGSKKIFYAVYDSIKLGSKTKKEIKTIYTSATNGSEFRRILPEGYWIENWNKLPNDCVVLLARKASENSKNELELFIMNPTDTIAKKAINPKIQAELTTFKQKFWTQN